MPSDPPQLDYAPGEPIRRSRRVRWLMRAAGIFVVLVVAVFFARSTLESMRLYRAYRQCASYAQSPSTIVLTALTFRPVPPPAAWLTLNQSISTGGTVFLREMRKPDGTRRLLGIDVVGGIGSGGSTSFMANYRIFSAASPLRAPRLVASRTVNMPSIPHYNGLSLYAGQIDPQQPDHFTITYTSGTGDGVIDGYLKDDDTVVLEHRRSSARNP